jgi:hypothetical protein
MKMLHFAYLNQFQLFIFVSMLFLPFQLAVQAQPNGKWQNGVDTIASGLLPQVNEMDWSIADPSSVSDSDAYIPIGYSPDNSLAYYLGHFHRLANGVRDSEPNRGFIDIHVWRRAEHQQPENARIMENILSLVWMYTRDEPWNPYYGDEATRLRIETAIEYWAGLQDENGHFGEGWITSGRDKTLFAIKYFGEILYRLKEGPEINHDVYELLRESVRKSIRLALTDADYWEQGINYSNQYGNLFGGTMAYLKLFDDPQITMDLKKRMLMMDEFQSTAGYMSEGLGPDWGYFFGTHNGNFFMAWQYARDMEIDGIDLAELVCDQYSKTIEWLAYNAVPDGDLFYLNRGIETRQTQNHFDRLETPLSEVVPLARAFNVTQDEYEDRLAWSRSKLDEEWGNPPPLRHNFHGYKPADFLFRGYDMWYPSETQRQDAYKQLPYIASDHFNHQRMDERTESMYTYVRRPNYYAAFNSGPILRGRQRMGLGLIWHPVAGAVFQSTSGIDDEAWGTVLLGDNLLIESGSPNPAFFKINGEVVEPQSGVHDLPDGDLKATYGGHVSRQLDKSVTFEEEQIHVSVDFQDEEQRFAELIPLMLDKNDRLVIKGNSAVFTRDEEIILVISFTGADQIQISQARQEGHLRRTWVLASAKGSLDYAINFDGEPLSTSTVDHPETLPRKVELLQNYPNPFNPATIIPFTLTEESRVQIEVFDAMGRRVAIVTDRNYAPGRHEINWDASEVSSGVYVVRLSMNSGDHNLPVKKERAITILK